jgi:uncharacterized membrane protein YfcA
LLIAVPSVVGFFFVALGVENLPPFTIGAVNLVAFGIIIAMTLITTPIGVALAHKLEAQRLKRYFAIFLVFVALNMLRKAAGY